MTDVFNDLKAKVSIEDYAAAHLTQHSRNKYLCPACGSGAHTHGTPALSFYHDSNDPAGRFTCFSCGIHGDIFDLVAIVEGIDTTDRKAQAQALAVWAGIEEPTFKGDKPMNNKKQVHATKQNTPQKPTEREIKPVEQKREYKEGQRNERAYIKRCIDNINNPAAVNYLKQRGYTLEDAKRFNLGYDPQTQRVIIPWRGSCYYHIDRDITDGVMRNADGSPKLDQNGEPKKRNKYDKPHADLVGAQPLWNEAALDGDGVVFVVEGALDALSVEIGGYEVIALGGANNFYSLVNAVEEHDFKGVLSIIADRDKTGIPAAEKLRAKLQENGRYAVVANLEDVADPADEVKDIDDYRRIHPDELHDALTWYADAALEDVRAAKEAAFNDALHSLRIKKPAAISEALQTMKNFKNPIPTGLVGIDRELGGLQSGLYALGAISSAGKTTLLLQIADHIAANGTPVLFVSIEQSGEELTAKSLSRYMAAAGVYMPYGNIRNKLERKKWSNKQRDAFNSAIEAYTSDTNDYLYLLEGTEQPTVTQIKAAALAISEHYEGDVTPVIFIDYLQLLAPQNDRDTEQQAIDKNVMYLRHLARDLNTPVIVISSINRQSYGAAISMSSYKQSGGVEYSADVLLGLQPRGMCDIMNDESISNEKERERQAKKLTATFREAKRDKKAELTVLKNRNGALPDHPINLTFNGGTSTFTTDN